MHGSSWDRVSPHFFETVGQPVIRGRGITDQDTATSRAVAVVNQTFVKRFFPNQDPIGQHFGTADLQHAGEYEIVGVVADAKYNNVREEFRPFFFRPITQWNKNFTEQNAIAGEARSLFVNAVVVRFQGNPQDLESGTRRIFSGISPDLTLTGFTTLKQQVTNNFNQERLIARLTSLFGVVALILASVGLYGITAYSVARRTSEIGVRMALGADRRHVLAMILRGALQQICMGLGIGIPIALLAGRVMAEQLYGVSAYDPGILGIAMFVLALSATFAGLIPAKRAASVEPMHALRTE
jgi:predicted permease